MAGAGLITELEDGVLTLTFDNPGRLNAMHPAMRAAIIAAFDWADADDDVRVVLVTGAGRGFCAGADMSRGTGAFVPASGDGEYRDGGGVLVRRLLESAKPIIGAVNGAAARIGAAMTLPMDFRLAAASARFGFVYTRRGIGPEGTSSWLLPAIVGPTTALDWLLTGRVFGAEEALARGLVTEVLPDDRLMPRARELARSLCETTAPLSVSLTRQLVWRQLDGRFGGGQLDGQLGGGQLGCGAVETAHRLESRVVPWLAATPDAAEGVSAFLEKRAPRFTGRPARDIPGWLPVGLLPGRLSGLSGRDGGRMSLPAQWRGALRLPVIAAPMFLASGPDLVVAACRSGVVGTFPALNQRTTEGYAAWLEEISGRLAGGPGLAAGRGRRRRSGSTSSCTRPTSGWRRISRSRSPTGYRS